jgi:predicted NBD/HSP70 family sugar kinase
MSPRVFSGSNILLVKAHNLRTILLSLLHEGRASRVQLAKNTHLSSTTITNLIGELLEQGIVIEEGLEETSEKRRVGRPRTDIRLVPGARYAVGVHIGIGLIRVAITNLFAEILYNNIWPFDIKQPASEVIQRIADSVQCVIQTSEIDRNRIIGLGVGASGLVDYSAGVNIWAPNLGWQDIPIRSLLEKATHLPVIVDNNVRAMALGEALFGAGRGVNSLAFVYGRVGVGAGFVVAGNVFRGSGAGAGEIGHTFMAIDQGKLCRCGNRGCLETMISEPELVSSAYDLATSDPISLLALYLADHKYERPIEAIFQAAHDGDIATRELISQRAEYLGMALANLVNIINPELIILGGLFSQGEEFFLPVVYDVVRACAFAGMGEKVRVQSTSFGWRAGVTGAAALALATNFYQQNGAN